MIDLKKLITGFLALAIFVSSGVFVFSGLFRDNQPAIRDNPSNLGKSSSDSLAIIGENAFVETLPESLGEEPDKTGDEKGLPPVVKSDNFTENLAQQLTREILQVNPDDPKSVAEKLNLVSVRASDFGDDIIDIQEISEFVANIKQKIDKASQDFSIDKNYGPDDLNNYITSLNDVLEKRLEQSRITELITNSQGSDLQAVSALELAISQTIQEVKALSVPESLANFNQSLLALLLYEQDALATAGKVKDPLKVTLIIEAQEKNYNNAISDFKKEFQKLKSSEGILLSGGSDKSFNFLASAFFYPKTAHAFLGIADISFDPANLARMIWEWLKNVALETLKNRLVKMVVDQTVNWIQGGGKPLYVTNWKGFVKNAFDRGVGEALYKLEPKLCSYFGPLVRTAIQLPRIDTYDQYTCTLNQVVDNLGQALDIDAFNVDFRAGGWSAFGAVIQPKNNFLGSLIQTRDEVEKAAAESQNIAESEAESGQGFLATRVCVAENVRSLSDFVGPIFDREAAARSLAEAYGEDFIKFLGGDTFKTCAEWEVTTPGVVAGRAVSDLVVSGPLDRIVGADNLAKLTSAFVDSALNKILTSGAEGLAGLNRNPSRRRRNVVQNCDSYAVGTQQYDDCVANAQEIEKLNQRLMLPKNTLLSITLGLKKSLESARDLYIKWLASYKTVTDSVEYLIKVCEVYRGQTAKFQQEVTSRFSDPLDILQLLSGACSKTITRFDDRGGDTLLDIFGNIGSVEKNKLETENTINSIDAFINKIRNTANPTQEELKDLTDELYNKFDPDFIKLTLDDAKRTWNQLVEYRKDVFTRGMNPYRDIWKPSIKSKLEAIADALLGP